jgi:chromate transport protein ChrA
MASMTGIFPALRAMAMAVLGLAMVAQFGPVCESAAVAAPATVAQACADMMSHKTQDRQHAGDCAAICVAIPALALVAPEPFTLAPVAMLAARLPRLSGIVTVPETPPPRLG